jgi:hypothetical protein
MATIPKAPKPPKGVKPGVNYFWNGRDWVYIQPKTAPKPSLGGPPRPTAPKPPGMTSDAWAESQAEKYVQAQVDAIKEQQGIFEQEQQAAYQRRIEQAKQMASYIQAQGFDTKIRDLYSRTGGDIAGMAQGFAGQTRGIAAADAAEQMNMLSGTGQEGAVRDQGTNMGDVLYGVGGFIPGKNMGETGAAMAANAALQPAFTLEKGQEDAAAGLAEGNDQAMEFAKAIAEAKAGKFSMKEDLLKQKTSTVLAIQKQTLDKLNDDREFWLKRQALYLSQHKDKLAAQAGARADAAEQRYGYESQGRDYEGNLMPGYTLGPQGQVIPPNMKVDKHGNVVKIYAPKTPKTAKPKFTPGQQQEIMKTVDKQEEPLKAAVAKAIRDGEWYVGSGPPAPKARAKLAQRLFKQYVHLAPTPAAKKLLRTLIQRILNQAMQAGGSATAGSTGTIVIPPAGG